MPCNTAFCADGVDYIEPINRYQLNRGEMRACIDTIIQNDDAFEFDETFTGELIRVTDLEGEVPLTENDGLSLDIEDTTITIEDNDGKGCSGGSRILPEKFPVLNTAPNSY